MQSFKFSKDSQTVKAQPEDLSHQIDRLNLALKDVMHEIEASSYSRNPSRLSVRTFEANNEDLLSQECSLMLDLNYDQTIESLLLTIDRQQMTIEDFRAEEMRRSPENAFEDLDRIRKEVWLEVKTQLRDKFERERKNLEEKTRQAEQLKEKYNTKNNEVMAVLQNLKQKEDLLNLKENEIRAQRLALDKLKMSQETSKQPKIIQQPPIKTSHTRSHSFSFYAAGRNETESSSLQETLKNLNLQLTALENELPFDDELGRSEKEMKIENIKNKIARVRSEIAISESNRGSCLINNMMESLQKEVEREEKMKRAELLQAASKNLQLNKQKPPLVPFKTPDGKTNRKDFNESSLGDAYSPNLEVLKENNLATKQKEKSVYDKRVLESQREESLQNAWGKTSNNSEFVENINLNTAKYQLDRRVTPRVKDDGLETKFRSFRKN